MLSRSLHLSMVRQATSIAHGLFEGVFSQEASNGSEHVSFCILSSLASCAVAQLCAGIVRRDGMDPCAKNLRLALGLAACFWCQHSCQHSTQPNLQHSISGFKLEHLWSGQDPRTSRTSIHWHAGLEVAALPPVCPCSAYAIRGVDDHVHHQTGVLF